MPQRKVPWKEDILLTQGDRARGTGRLPLAKPGLLPYLQPFLTETLTRGRGGVGLGRGGCSGVDLKSMIPRGGLTGEG